MNRNINWRTVVVTSLVCAPALVLAALLARYAVNVPFWDQWELPTLLKKMHDGTATFGDFFAQHNEHRILFPRFIMVGLAFLTAWNTMYEVAVNVVLAIGIFGLLWLLVKRTFANQRLRLMAAFIMSLILFSPIQFENWMWGWQIQWYLNVIGLVLAIWALGSRKSPILRLVVAALGASLATYSLASGFFVWLVCVPLLWFAPEMRKLLPYWIASAVAVVGSHYIGYVDPSYHPSKLIFLKEPIEFVVYLLVYIGRPLVIDFLISVPVALTYLAGSVVTLIRVWQKNIRELTGSLLPWLCLGLYGLLAALSTAVSRLGLGIEQAYSNRYITLSMLFLMAVVVVLIKLYQLSPGKTLRSLRYGLASGLAIIVMLVGINYLKGAAQMRERHTYLLGVQDCARKAQQDDDCLLKLYPNKEAVWPRLEYLRSIHWGGL